MNYLKAVLNNNQEQEIKNLKILISSGNKLKKDISKYKKELKKYNGAISKYTKKTEPIKPIKVEPKKPTKVIKKQSPTPKKATEKKVSKPKLSKNSNDNLKYTISSVYTKNNQVFINFKTDINKKYVKFFEERVKNGYQDIYDIKGNFKDARPTKLKIPGIKRIVINQNDKKTLRILFEDRKNLKTVYSIRKKQIVLTVLNIKKTTTSNKTKTIVNKPKRRVINKIVVIDAGHGGKDPGAVGTNKKYEKVVAFNTTKYLESILKKRGYKVYLTRYTDKFIKVRKRPIIANKKKADIFISIHANAVPKAKRHKIQGIETYFLSPARSERAKRVAARENQSDIKEMSNSTKLAFLESLNRPRITASHKLAIDIQKNMLYNARQRYKDVVDMGVREGPFYVLVGAQMPSILIELGFISHPIEGERLYNKRYQQKLALGIANGVDAYFAKNP